MLLMFVIDCSVLQKKNVVFIFIFFTEKHKRIPLHYGLKEKKMFAVFFNDITLLKM